MTADHGNHLLRLPAPRAEPPTLCPCPHATAAAARARVIDNARSHADGVAARCNAERQRLRAQCPRAAASPSSNRQPRHLPRRLSELSTKLSTVFLVFPGCGHTSAGDCSRRIFSTRWRFFSTRWRFFPTRWRISPPGGDFFPPEGRVFFIDRFNPSPPTAPGFTVGSLIGLKRCGGGLLEGGSLPYHR